MADIVHASVTVVVVWGFDIVTTHILSLGADSLATERGGIDFTAQSNLVQTSIMHKACKLHVIVDGLVDKLDSIRVLNGEFGIVWRLDIFGDDAVNDSQVNKFEIFARLGTVLDRLVLLLEIVEEGRSVVS